MIYNFDRASGITGPVCGQETPFGRVLNLRLSLKVLRTLAVLCTRKVWNHHTTVEFNGLFWRQSESNTSVTATLSSKIVRVSSYMR